MSKDALIKQQGWYAHSGTTCKRCGGDHGPWQTANGTQELWGCVQCGIGVVCGGEGQPTTDEAADRYMSMLK